jgi:hypothetical protein
MNLDCFLGYSGPTRPSLDWYRVSAAGARRHNRRDAHSKQVLINSVDEYDLGEESPIARKVRDVVDRTVRNHRI